MDQLREALCFHIQALELDNHQLSGNATLELNDMFRKSPSSLKMGKSIQPRSKQNKPIKGERMENISIKLRRNYG